MDRSRLYGALLSGMLFAGCVGANTIDQHGTTSLMWAAQAGDLAKVKRLVGQGANVNAVNGNGVSVLFHTTYYKRAEAARYLMQNGAKPANEIERVAVEAMMREAPVPESL
ncbi:MAG: ankyrin repeat domain-containing protein [Elusimicrobiota bacterium]